MILQSTRVWAAGQFLPLQLQIEGDKIVQVLEYKSQEADEDWGDKRIVPGFIDVHTHGPMASIPTTRSRKS